MPIRVEHEQAVNLICPHHFFSLCDVVLKRAGEQFLDIAPAMSKPVTGNALRYALMQISRSDDIPTARPSLSITTGTQPISLSHII